jgi:hypothetical protein
MISVNSAGLADSSVPLTMAAILILARCDFAAAEYARRAELVWISVGERFRASALRTLADQAMLLPVTPLGGPNPFQDGRKNSLPDPGAFLWRGPHRLAWLDGERGVEHGQSLERSDGSKVAG